MLIGIDANEANVEKKVGISEYSFQLLQALFGLRKKEKNNHEYIIYLKDSPLDLLPPETSFWRYKVVKPRRLWTQLGFPIHLFTTNEKPDVLFVTTHYIPRFSSVPTLVSVMDLSYISYPETFKKKDLYQLRSWTRYSVKKAKKVITISKNSKDDIMREYKVSENKVIVIYPGVKALKENVMDKRTINLGIDSEYILYVGTLQPRKNVERLIEAFSKLKYKDLKLVIVGRKGWLYEDIISAPERLGITDKVQFLDFVSNEDLSSVYNNAKCFVLPSLYEGFGLPILEAMRYGCPVITSDVSSLPEAGGDAAIYVDPNNVLDIKEKIEKVIDDKDLREKMIKKGYAHYKKFTWEDSAIKVLKVIEEIGGKN